MPITTSYFAVAKHLKGTKISVARFSHPKIRGKIDEIISSFAPSATLLTSYKKGKISWEEYTEIYLREQRRHYRNNPSDFENILERAEEENLVLLCYEKYEGKETQCHRMLLVDILRKVADVERYEVEFVDEEHYSKG